MMNRDEQRAKRDEAIKAHKTIRPTPTQEEADLAALGVPHGQIEKQPTGASPDRHVERNKERMREMRPETPKGKGYETR